MGLGEKLGVLLARTRLPSARRAADYYSSYDDAALAPLSFDRGG
jgi:hypothetical protein